jgi:hypothetical protein
VSGASRSTGRIGLILAWIARVYESKSFVYLDLQKTGTNFIVDFLRRFSNEGDGRRKKHRAIKGRPKLYAAGKGGERPRKLHFISVRDPLDQYLSLYSFGCGGEGAIFQKLERKGLAKLYERSAAGFQNWLAFVLDPNSAEVMGVRYATASDGRLPALVGFQSYRFLNLAFHEPAEVFASCMTKQDLAEAYRTRSIVSVVIRHSHFIDDLQSLVQNHLQDAISDLDAALSFLREAPVLNRSERIDKDGELTLDDRTAGLLKEREWLFYDGIVET